jgi:penicillin-binding protein 1B
VPRYRRIVLGLAAAGLCLAGFGVVRLDREVAARLGPDAVVAHARLFAAPFRIMEGMDLEGAAVFERLREVGYREDGALARPGTWRRRSGRLELRLPAFDDVVHPLPERRVRIDLAGTTVRAIVDVPSGDRHVGVTLEPALLGVTWNGGWQRRRPVRLAALPHHVTDAVLAAEDARFRQHWGIDLRGIGRALRANVEARAVVQGASTITQQLAKNVFLTPRRTLARKLQEAVLALLIERRYTKDEILGLYLNEIYLGRADATNIVGIGEAARLFFGKDASALSVGEAATIAGIIHAPNRDSPLRYPGRAERRRNLVLRRMVRSGFLARADELAARRVPLKPRSDPVPAIEGLFFLEEVRREVESRLGADALGNRRLDVFTTLDTRMQRAAERGVATTLATLESRHRWLRGRKQALEGAFVVLDTRRGAIRALVGGRDFAHRPFDRAVTARRQAGSTFKPFVYLAAFTAEPARITASSLVQDRPLTLHVAGERWRPENYDGVFRGPVTVRTALEKSLNVPTVRLSEDVGIDAVARIAHAAGWKGELPRVPALALGVAETSLVELAASYAIFPRGGTTIVPHAVRAVRLPDRAVPFEPVVADTPTSADLDPRAVYLVHHLLEGVVDRGTARALRARGFRGPLAGKTGTTNEYRDAWFVGYTPDLVAASWVGFDDGRPLRLSSAATALEVWAEVMRPISRAQRTVRFAVPPGIVFRDVDPTSGLLPTPACPRTVREAFLDGTAPERACVTRPALLAPSDRFDEVFDEPVRVLGNWMREARRFFEGATHRRR